MKAEPGTVALTRMSQREAEQGPLLAAEAGDSKVEVARPWSSLLLRVAAICFCCCLLPLTCWPLSVVRCLFCFGGHGTWSLSSTERQPKALPQNTIYFPNESLRLRYIVAGRNPRESRWLQPGWRKQAVVERLMGHLRKQEGRPPQGDRPMVAPCDGRELDCGVARCRVCRLQGFCDLMRLCSLNYSAAAANSVSPKRRRRYVLAQFGDTLGPCGTHSPIFVKSRKVGGCGIVLPLNQPRHWDAVLATSARGLGSALAALRSTPWEHKLGALVWRGATTGDGLRRRFVHGLASQGHNVRFHKVTQGKQAWILDRGHQGRPLTSGQIAGHRFVLSLEGNDVATNLKWLLASSSVVVMPTPTKESWLMEGLLRPYVHYLPLNSPDEAPGLLRWAATHDADCRQIVANANDWLRRVIHGFPKPAAAALRVGAVDLPLR